MLNSITLKWAQYYIKRRWYIFPTKNKIPLTKHGFKEASIDPEQIVDWWEFEYPDAGIALATGEISGVSVIDIDPRNGGYDSLPKLGQIRCSLKSYTGGGGEHWFFNHKEGLKSGKLLEGIDIKSDGGYVILPPSMHESGNEYAWQNEEELEDILYDFPYLDIPTVYTEYKPTNWVCDELGNLKKGYRHSSFVKIIGKLCRGKFKPKEIFTLLFPHAERVNYSEQELWKDINDIFERYYKGESCKRDPGWSMFLGNQKR